MRALHIPTMLDRAMQALYLLALSPVSETTGDEASYGFRPRRSTADAIGRCFILLSKRASAQWVLEGDIRSCFDRISHDWLLAHVPMEPAILRKWLKAGFMDRSTLYPTRDGTPQGGIISPVLANLALDGLQALLRQHFPRRARLKVNLVRYADDFIITGASHEVLEQQVRPLVERFLAARGLELSPDKTVITHIEQGFDFLGQNIRKYGGKMLIKPSKASIRSVRRESGQIIKSSGALTAGQVIHRLNPLLRGWAQYHRHVVSSDAFQSVDHYIWHALLRWARRRHPGRSANWVLSKYFPSHQGRRFVFTGFADDRTAPQVVRIYRTGSVPIRRHVFVRGAANPFDPAWETYFRRRRAASVVRAARWPRPFSDVSPRPVRVADAEA
jgi:RNA-directed DNA polymerase